MLQKPVQQQQSTAGETMQPRRALVWRSILSTAVLALGALVGATPAHAADTSCPVGTSCFWLQQNYEGLKKVRGNISVGTWQFLTVEEGVIFNSVKNRFTDRAVWTKRGAQDPTCTPAGGERPTAPGFTQFYVGTSGSHC
jgi:hypothetical protein